jgi:hypothetical protein
MGDDARTILLKLRDGFVPQRFFEFAERKRTGVASADEQRTLEDLKLHLSARLWEEPLEALFDLRGVTREEERTCA